MYLVVYFSSHYEGRAEPGFVFKPRLSMLGAVKMADDRGMLQYVQLPENKTERKRNCMVRKLREISEEIFPVLLYFCPLFICAGFSIGHEQC